MIIYMHKIRMGLVPNIGFTFQENNARTGVKVNIKRNRKAPSWVQTIRHHSFFTKGPMLYNAIPADLRTSDKVTNPENGLLTSFKCKLDKWLELIPDEPTTDGLVRAANSNSITVQAITHVRTIQQKWRNLQNKAIGMERKTTNTTG